MNLLRFLTITALAAACAAGSPKAPTEAHLPADVQVSDSDTSPER